MLGLGAYGSSSEDEGSVLKAARTPKLYATEENPSLLQKSSPFSSQRSLIRDMTLPPHPNLDIPPSPSRSPSPSSNQKFIHFLSLKKQGIHFNEKLASSSSLKNPSLLPSLMQHAGLEEKSQYATSLGENIWDVTGLPQWGYKEELQKSQQEIRRRVQEKKESTLRESIDFVQASKDYRRDTSATKISTTSAAERVMAGLNPEETGFPSHDGQDRNRHRTR
ncbi:hypothetical protein PRK78_005831 [Emydomyces testavorans]|uniref:Uncharacterized protein n=1 Tax=Emydomyces testavorans TaxID=2070801 RepID=A0AAF0DKB2_9EURO|nr:hypothetical protein PRK78_005831 [Emydomyces testavorans]